MTRREKDRAKEKRPDGGEKLMAKGGTKVREREVCTHDLGSAHSASDAGWLRTSMALSPEQHVSEPHSPFGIESVSRTPDCNA